MVKAKKHLGQHFLRDENVARSIVDLLQGDGVEHVLEIGPGTGVLTKYLMAREDLITHVVELDRESVAYLKQHFHELVPRIYEEDFLQMDLSKVGVPLAIIGNFPYNISSQILFKVLDCKDSVPELVGMFQKEVATRVASGPGSKNYGILSVLLQAYYDIDYMIDVPAHVFEPPPKVESGVIRMTRNKRIELPCEPALFKTIVKTAFNQRRKTLRNSLRGIMNGRDLPDELTAQRPEQLGVEEFIQIAELVQDQ